MPTYERTHQFKRDLDALDEVARRAFRRSVRRFVEDLSTGRFRPGLRVRGIQGATGVFEMTWAPDGRATFEYGEERIEGQPQVIWRRVGTHHIFGSP